MAVGELYPTKTRLALLQAVADGAVVVDRYGQAAFDDPWGNRLTARWAEAHRVAGPWRPVDIEEAERGE